MIGKPSQCPIIFISDCFRRYSFFRFIGMDPLNHCLQPVRLSICVVASHGIANQRIHRYVKEFGEVHDEREIRLRASSLPFGNRAQRDAEPLRQLLLRKPQAFAITADVFSQNILHMYPPAFFRLVLLLPVRMEVFTSFIGIG